MQQAIRCWDFEVSNDENHWEKIDNREDATDLNAENKIGVFKVSKEHEPSRFIQSTQRKITGITVTHLLLASLNFLVK